MRFSESTFANLFVAALLFGLGVVCGNCARSIAVAQDDEPTALQRAYALDVARTAVNEASLSARVADVSLVYEATRSHGRDDATRLRWLRRHSACTNPRGDCNRDGVVDEHDTTAAEARPGNARWTRQLVASDRRPPNLDAAHWRAEWWQRVRALALRLVLADRPTGVCGGPVSTWGRRSDFAGRPGLVRIECGARNFGGRRARPRVRLALGPEAR